MTHPTSDIVTPCQYCESCSIPFGFCHCGCGTPTSLSNFTIKRRGNYKGMPVKFARGHAGVIPRPNTDEMPEFYVGDTLCRLIALTMDQFATVEASRYSEFRQYFYRAKKRERGAGGYYAARHGKDSAGNDVCIYMHREVMGVGPDDELEVDHKNPRLTLLNIPSNLRMATPNQQRGNIGLRSNNTSGSKGACWDRRRKRWFAQIRFKGKHYFLGYFATREESAEAYRRAAVKHYGEFANFG